MRREKTWISPKGREEVQWKQPKRRPNIEREVNKNDQLTQRTMK